MKRSIFAAAVIAILFISTSAMADKYGRSRHIWSSRADSSEDYDFKQLHHEISLRNLVNGLLLSKKQSKQILDLARKAEAIHTQMESEGDAIRQRGITAMKQINDALKEGKEAPQDAVNEAFQAEMKLSSAMKSHVQKLHALESQIGDVLSENQIAIVENFKPCLTLPKDTQNPSPAGAAADGSRLEKALIRLYEADEQRYQRFSGRFFEKHIQRLEKREGPMSEQAAQQEMARLREIVDRARAMDRTEFEMNKSDLAAEMFAPMLQSEKRVKKAQKMNQSRWKMGKVGKWMLDPMIVPILEGK